MRTPAHDNVFDLNALHPGTVFSHPRTAGRPCVCARPSVARRRERGGPQVIP
jgi:hypothetical protein